MPNDTPDVFIEYIENDTSLDIALQDQSRTLPKFPPSEEGALHTAALMIREIDFGPVEGESDGLLEVITYHDVFDFLSDEFSKSRPNQLFRIEVFGLAPRNESGYPNRSMYEMRNLSELRAHVTDFMRDLYPSDINETYELTYHVGTKPKRDRFNLSVSYHPYYPNTNYELVEIDLFRGQNNRGNNMSEKIFIVVNHDNPGELQGIFYISYHDFNTNVPTPFMVGIDVNEFVVPTARICRPVTKSEQFGVLPDNVDPKVRANNIHYATIAIARASKILGLVNGSDYSGKYE